MLSVSIAPFTGTKSAALLYRQGPNIMKCYWGDTSTFPFFYAPGITVLTAYLSTGATEAAVTKDGWLKTGDIGYLDREGFLYIKDRGKVDSRSFKMPNGCAKQALFLF